MFRGLAADAGDAKTIVAEAAQLFSAQIPELTRVDKRPQLADLREGGDLENTADSARGCTATRSTSKTTTIEVWPN